MIEIELYNLLKEIEKTYPKKAPQNVQTPYIIYHVISDVSNQCFSGATYQNDIRFQVDIWAKTYNECKQLKKQVLDSLIGFKSSNNIFCMDDYESDTELYREMIDFKLKG